MPRTTQQRWLIGAATAVGGLCLAFVIDLLVRRPGVVVSILLLAYLVTRPTTPLCYTISLLDRSRAPLAYEFANYVLPLAIIGALGGGTWANHEQYGFAVAFAATFIELYVIDRLAAFLIDRVAGYVRYRRVRWQEQAEAPVAEPVDALVVDEPVGEAAR